MPWIAFAQRGDRLFRIAFLRQGPPPPSWIPAFEAGLRGHGYVQGKNLIIEYVITDGDPDSLRRAAQDLARRKVDVVVASAGAAADAARRASNELPVLFVGVFDPVEAGLVPNLGKPGRNVTGLSFSALDLSGKRLQLLREILPDLKRIAVLSDPRHPIAAAQMKANKAAAAALGMAVVEALVVEASELERAFAVADGSDAMLVHEQVLTTTHRERIAALAMQAKLPTVYGGKPYVEAGGLISYGPDYTDLYRRAAIYVDKILRGAKPGDLPVEQPSKYEMAINLKTARALGVDVPHSLLSRADQVIR